MKKLKKGDIKKFREDYRSLYRGEVMVSMGTCGIAAGGQKIYDLLKRELKNAGLEDVIAIKKTGCLGMCFCEPNLIVKLEGMDDTLYGFVDEEIAYRIVREHVAKKRIINNHVIFMPTDDIGAKIFKREDK